MQYDSYAHHLWDFLTNLASIAILEIILAHTSRNSDQQVAFILDPKSFYRPIFYIEHVPWFPANTLGAS